MRDPTISIRTAIPAFEEGQRFACYADQASEGFFRFMLGHRVADVIATAYAYPNHDLSYRNVLVAERDAAILGMASSFSAEERRHFSEQPLRKAAGSALFRMLAVRAFGAPLWRALDRLADGDFYLLAIAVEESVRGQGVGSMLLDAVEERARAAGAKRLSLDVATNNRGARKLYESRGMRTESVWPRLPGVSPLFVRMTRLL